MSWFSRHPFLAGAVFGGLCLLAMVVLFGAANASGTSPALSGVLKALGLAMLAVPLVVVAIKVARGSKAEVASRRRCPRCGDDLTDIPGAVSCPNCGLPVDPQTPRV